MNQPYQTIGDLWSLRLQQRRRRERIARAVCCVGIPLALGLLLYLKLH